MNRHAKSWAGLLPLLALLPLSGCASRPERTLNPPDSSEWVTITVKLPPDTKVIPMDVLYRSDKCQQKDYDPTTESHIRDIRGFNPRQADMTPLGGGVWQARIALDGGGKCEWKLSAFRVGIEPSASIALTQGKDVIATNYVFDFDEEGYSGGFGVGKIRNAHGDQRIATEFFPMITHHRDGEIDVELYGGRTGYEKWSRHYRLYNTKLISIEPVVYMDKIVTLRPPEPPPGDFTAIYPDGSSGKIKDIDPDYDKLLSMK
ncbi:hypothetical protein ACWKYD_05435 [Enterobacter cloacae]